MTDFRVNLKQTGSLQPSCFLVQLPSALGCKTKHKNVSPHQLHLSVGPSADQLHFVKVGELHLQLLQLTRCLLICRVHTTIYFQRRRQKSNKSLILYSKDKQQQRGGGINI